MAYLKDALFQMVNDEAYAHHKKDLLTVHAKVINKVIPPHRMFYLGMKSAREKILALVKQNLTKRAK